MPPPRLARCSGAGDLTACLDHPLEAAGNLALMIPELKTALVDHAAGADTPPAPTASR